jgi:anti-sigma regulatory factor (Ser/Thr protein kinase)
MPAHPIPPQRTAAPLPARDRTRTFPGHREHARNAREFIAAILGAHHAAGDAVLLISELSANAVAHSASGQPGGQFTVRARVDDDGHVHAQVEDQGSPWDGNLTAAEAPHGLYLLRALSTACGTRRSEQGWVTWFTLTARAPGQAPQP